MNVGPTVSQPQLVRQLRDPGVAAGDVLLVHTSFRALRPIEDGPEGLIEALRQAVAPGGTVVMPSGAATNDEPFDPERSVPPADVGIVAQLFWRLPGVEPTFYSCCQTYQATKIRRRTRIATLKGE